MSRVEEGRFVGRERSTVLLSGTSVQQNLNSSAAGFKFPMVLYGAVLSGGVRNTQGQETATLAVCCYSHLTFGRHQLAEGAFLPA